jgi:hypothetical protein
VPPKEPAVSNERLLSDDVINALWMPPVEWEAYADTIPRETVGELSADLQNLALKAAREAAYLNARALGRSHNMSVRASNTVVKALAKALGFTYPEKHTLQF